MIQKVLLLTHLATVVRVIVPISFELGCTQKAVKWVFTATTTKMISYVLVNT